MSAWAGSDDDVFDLLTTNNRTGAFTGIWPPLIRAYVEARGRDEDPVQAVFRKHYGSLAFVPGHSAAEGTIRMCRDFDEGVAFLRGAGHNILGAAGR